MLILAPLFDDARFPAWRYQRGGLVHDSVVQPPDTWTVTLVPKLLSWARQQEQRGNLPCMMIGHSAGAQFLSRFVAFAPTSTTRIVIANPSTWVEPSEDVAAPYGFGGIYDPVRAAAALRAYLAAPVTVLLGEDDVGSKNLATAQQAEAQGSNRLDRGRNVFRQAEQSARQHGWPFNWHLAIVPGVGHDAARMFGSEPMLTALRP